MTLRRKRRHLAPPMSALLICLVGVSYAHADVTFNVNTTADLLDQDTGDGVCLTASGQCSLRAAIMQANHLIGPIATHIRLPAGNYMLTRLASGSNGEDSGDLNFTAPLSAAQMTFIDGAAPATTLIDANQSGRVLKISAGRSVVVNRVTIRGGFVSNDSGGGIRNEGSVQLVDSVVEGNVCDHLGGGILSFGTLDVRRSTLRNNTGIGGRAIFATIATVRESSLYGNLSRSDGGAIYLAGSYSTDYLIVVNSTISANAANRNGGGIVSVGAVSIYNSSIINNDADHDRDELGGIGGGVWVDPQARFIAVNSLIAANTVNDAPIPDDCNGTLEVYGRNLMGTLDGCTFTGNGTAARGLISTNTIGPLQDNGGPTWTHALLAGSEAIDATTAQGCVDDTLATLATDQRGAARIAGLRCDVGAYEYGATPPVSDRIFATGFEVVP